MPSIQKIVIALTFVASTFAAQISDGQIQQLSTAPAVVKQITDGQIQQVTSTPTPVAVTPAVKQITDGQIQQVTSTPTPIISPPVKQITDGQIQQVASASLKPSPSVNATTVTTASPVPFKGAASLMSYSKDLAVVAIGAAAVFVAL